MEGEQRVAAGALLGKERTKSNGGEEENCKAKDPRCWDFEHAGWSLRERAVEFATLSVILDLADCWI